MAVKRYIAILFIAIMLTSYLYLSNKYNLNTVEYAFRGDLSFEQFEGLRKSTKTLIKKGTENKELVSVINYIGSFRGSRLIMTTGFDNLVKYIPIIKGRFIGDSQTREAVIGDEAANRLYRSINVVGQTINIYGQKYKITGIIKNSDDIYMTFDEISNISWDKKNIKFIIENKKYLYLYTEMLEGKLRILNLDVLGRVIYKQEAYIYINIILVAIILFLSRGLKNQVKKIISSFKEICADYKEHSRSIEIIKYLKKHINDIFKTAKELFLSVVSLAAIIKFISLLQIPPDAIPNNLFAPSSYIAVINLNADIFLSRLDYGINGIIRDIFIINIFLLTALLGTAFFKKR